MCNTLSPSSGPGSALVCRGRVRVSGLLRCYLSPGAADITGGGGSHYHTQHRVTLTLITPLPMGKTEGAGILAFAFPDIGAAPSLAWSRLICPL